MLDEEYILDSLNQIKRALNIIMLRSEKVNNVENFTHSQEGMLLLDALCMNLIALGESVKGLDKITNGELLPKYKDVYWAGVMRMRDKIAHHYFDVDPDMVFQTIKEDVPQMLDVVTKMINDMFISEN